MLVEERLVPTSDDLGWKFPSGNYQPRKLVFMLNKAISLDRMEFYDVLKIENLTYILIYYNKKKYFAEIRAEERHLNEPEKI